QSSRNALIEGNRLSGNGVAINLFDSSDRARIIDNQVADNAFGLQLSISNQALIRGNQFLRNRDGGLLVDSSTVSDGTAEDTVIEANRALHNGGDGIRVVAYSPRTVVK